MSVTITIANNDTYCKNNNLVTQDVYECQQCSFDGVSPNCQECGGNGKVSFDHFPFERNLANGNFRTLFASLALEPGEYLNGEIDARTMKKALRSAEVALIEREGRTEGEQGKVVIHHCGIDKEQASRYLEWLLEITAEAERREEMIVWG